MYRKRIVSVNSSFKYIPISVGREVCVRGKQAFYTYSIYICVFIYICICVGERSIMCENSSITTYACVWCRENTVSVYSMCFNYVCIYRVRTVHEQSVHVCTHASIYSYIRQERVLCVRMALTISTHVYIWRENISTYRYAYIYASQRVYVEVGGWRERVMETVFVCMNFSHSFCYLYMSKYINMARERIYVNRDYG